MLTSWLRKLSRQLRYQPSPEGLVEGERMQAVINNMVTMCKFVGPSSDGAYVLVFRTGYLFLLK